MMNKFLLFTAIVFCTQGVMAQQYEQRQEFSVMNPTSFEMSRFELTPINQYTGKANVNFPLCGISIDEKEVAFSLSYDTGGVRVAQEATWVGLGWNLSGIPVITHQINQRSDIGNKSNPSQGYCFEPALPEDGLTQEYIDWVDSSPNIPYGQPDTQPDVFVANLIGSTVKFQLTKEDVTTSINAIILNESNAAIDYDKNTQNFIITDEEGYQYNFSHIEYTTSWTESAGGFLYEIEPKYITGVDGSTQYNTTHDRWIPSAWYVDQIISPSGEVLDFRYDDEIDDMPNVTVSHPSYNESVTVDLCGKAIQGGNFDDWQYGVFNQKITASRTIQELKILSEIENSTTKEKLIFKTDSRSDIHPYSSNYLGGYIYPTGATDNTPKRLTEIELVSPTKSIKKVSFQQTYFNEYQSTNTDAIDYLRLKLDGFKINDQQYAFKYKCDDALPEKHSKSTDFWGFYNGANNSWRIPYVKVEGNCPFDNPDIEIDEAVLSLGAKKGSSYCDALIGSLEEIRYPTGGTTKFIYSPNEVTIDPFDNEVNANDFNWSYLLNHNIDPDYPKELTSDPNIKTYIVGGLRVKSVINTDESNTPLLEKTYDYTNLIAPGNLISSGKLMDALHFFTPTIRTSGDQSSNSPTYNGNIVFGVVIGTANVFGTNASAMGSFLGYDRVVETIESTTNSSINGSIISEYINEPNESLTKELDGYSFIIETLPFNYGDANGKLSKQEVYDSSNNLKSFSEFEYALDIYSGVTTNDFVQNGYKIYYTNTNFGGYIRDFYEYDARKFVAHLTKSRSIEYLENGDVEKVELNSYNEYDRIESVVKTISKTPTIDYDSNVFSPSISERTEFYYPYDLEYNVNSSSISADLLAKNQISQPIYSRFYNNNKFVGHQLTKFQNIDLSVDYPNNDNLIYDNITKPEGIYFNKEDKNLSEIENRVKHEKYDSYGNLVQYRQADGIPISAIWGHNGKYMVAKIENATYAQIEGLNVFGNGFDLGGSGLSEAQKTALQGLSNSMSTFYDYDPLVGITKVTDPRGYETKYTYDNYNRLKEIRDKADNLIEDYNYSFVDVPLYPKEAYSECFNKLLIGPIQVLDNRPQYFQLKVEPEGGFGNYTIQWFISTDTNKRTAQYQLVGTGETFQYEICCEQDILIKVVVTDGTQTISQVTKNPNQAETLGELECPENYCDNPDNY